MPEIPLLVSSATNTLTVQDVILDSPVWRANVAHIEDQIEHFEKWVDGFVRALKSYLDAIQKYNTQASVLCKRTFITGLDDTLIDTAGSLVQKFATCLQSTIAYRMKMASDLEDMLLNPLSAVIKGELKEFKESRRQFEKILEKYENQLSRYSLLSKQKEPSALREDAFQMYDLQKLYVKQSGDYFVKLTTFKSNLENLLVQCFTGALGAYVDEMDESNTTYRDIHESLPGWKQWLEESKHTFDYQIQHIKKKCIELEDTYVAQIQPPRSLKRYSTTSNDQMMAVSGEDDEPDNNNNTSSNEAVHPNKQGYLYAKIVPSGRNTRGSWIRKWFFLEQGIFGSCTVSTVNKEKGCIVLADRIPINECVCKISTDLDRRYCFEVIHPKCSYYLQAETEKEMQKWLWTFEFCKNNESSETISETSRVLLSPKSIMKDRLTPTVDTTNSCSMTTTAATTSPLSCPNEAVQKDGILSPIASTASSLTSLLIREGVPTTEKGDDNDELSPKENNGGGASGNSFLSSSSPWGMPWLATNINVLSSSSSNPGSSDESDSTAEKLNPDQLVVWPTKVEMDVSKPNLVNYTSYLETKQRELRRLFSNVPTNEVVLESFKASLYCEPSQEAMATNQSFGYSGNVYLTQDNFWFYSCTLMACVNTIIIPLEDIKTVRLEESGKMISIETKSSNKPFHFGIWLGSAKLASERLKTLVEYATKPHRESLQAIYDTLQKMSLETIPVLTKSKIPTHQVTTSRTLFTTLTPVTVQAQQANSDVNSNNNSSSTSVYNDQAENNHNPVDESFSGRASPAQGALTAAYQAALSKRKSAPVMRVSPPSPTATTSEKLSQTQTSTTSDEIEWPSDVPQPNGPVSCGCEDHLEKIESDIVLPISAKKLFDLMFTQTEIWRELNQKKNYGEPSFTEWEKNESGHKERVSTYMMPVSMPMVKAKETNVVDTQEIIVEKQHTCYVVIVSTKTPNLSYADAFIPRIKYCITYSSPSSCRLVSSLGIKWLRSIMVKGIVNKAATKGMTETINEVIPIIQQHASKMTTKKGSDNVPLPPASSSTQADSKKEQQPLTEDKTKGGDGVNWLQRLVTFFMFVMCFSLALYQIYMQQKYQSLFTGHTITWRGVYLRDVENEVIQKDITLGYIDPSLYKRFQEARNDSTHWNYNWTSKRHRAMATELIYSRERLGSLRYELLSVFRIMNRVEYQLIENEYWNWISDMKLQCDTAESTELCDDITREIKTE